MFSKFNARRACNIDMKQQLKELKELRFEKRFAESARARGRFQDSHSHLLYTIWYSLRQPTH